MTGEHAAYRAAGVRYALWMGGSRGEFDRELETIEAKVIELLGLVVEDLAAATQALLGNDGETGGILAEREQLIDALYVEIEDLAVREILLQAPVAADLRFLLTVLRVVPELERSHDLVVRIASQASLIRGGDLPPGVTGLAGRMADLVSVMWRQAADAWYERDRSVAAALRAARCRQGRDDLGRTFRLSRDMNPAPRAQGPARMTARDGTSSVRRIGGDAPCGPAGSRCAGKSGRCGLRRAAEPTMDTGTFFPSPVRPLRPWFRRGCRPQRAGPHRSAGRRR